MASAHDSMCRAMRSWVPFATAAVMSGILAACAHPLLAPDDRKDACRVAVEENFGSPVFYANVLSGPAVGLAGAGGGAFWGLMYGLGPQAIVTVPISALIGVFQAGVCEAASHTGNRTRVDQDRPTNGCTAGLGESRLRLQFALFGDRRSHRKIAHVQHRAQASRIAGKMSTSSAQAMKNVYATTTKRVRASPPKRDPP